MNKPTAKPLPQKDHIKLLKHAYKILKKSDWKYQEFVDMYEFKTPKTNKVKGHFEVFHVFSTQMAHMYNNPNDTIHHHLNTITSNVLLGNLEHITFERTESTKKDATHNYGLWGKYFQLTPHQNHHKEGTAYQLEKQIPHYPKPASPIVITHFTESDDNSGESDNGYYNPMKNSDGWNEAKDINQEQFKQQVLTQIKNKIQELKKRD